MNTTTLDQKIEELKHQTLSREYKKLGYSSVETLSMVKSLNLLLASYQVHYQKLRNFHWNVRGEDFFDLHSLFEQLYNEAQVHIDEIAERIRVFGQTPYSTMSGYLEHTEIKEVGTNLMSKDMVREVLADFRILVTLMNEVSETAIESGDHATQDLINSYIRSIEKHHWMLSAFLNE